MPVTVPPIPVPVPTTNDRANFALRADATLGALPAVVDGMNAQNIENNLLHGQIHTEVNEALAAGLANAANNAAAAAADRVQTGQDRVQTGLDRAAAAASAASAAAVVGLPAPTGADAGKFLGYDGTEMKWLPAGLRMVTEYRTTGTSWPAPAALVGNRVRATAVGAGAGGNNGGGVVGNSGAPGGVAVGVFAVSPGDVVPYTVGAPGAAGTTGLGGAGGNTTIFGMTANGGPAPATPTQALLAGGVASGGQLSMVAAIVRSGALSLSAGPTPFGRTGLRSGSDTVPASGFGVGGFGGTTLGAQEDGRPGLIVLEYLVSITP